ASDEGVQINAVFDGHGGSRAVEHLQTSLCQHILAEVTSKNSSDEIATIVKSAFARCDEQLKQSLMVLPPSVRMSKGYCNAGSSGSLAMTRAFGDFYLKCPELSSAPFKSKVPYITSEPSITTVYMDGSEKYVILASDGLWDVMTPQEAVHIVDKFGTST
uniref:PPM-type phosphatase domain-containing protein n=1 Tax=Phytophthora ramorum TaxID=164328 RepID=H3HE10_PHYRM